MFGSVRSAPKWVACATLVLALAYALRAYAVGTPALRGDEAFNAGVVQMPLAEIIALMGHEEPNPPLYLLLLKGWVAVAGSSELSLRWPSVLAGVVGVALTYRLGLSWVGRRASFIAATLTAVSPFLIWYAQDARAYALWVTLGLAALWQMWLAATRPNARQWWWAGGLWGLALMTHYLTALMLGASVAALLLAPRTRGQWRPAFITFAGVGLLNLPWGIYIAPLLIGHTKGWIVPLSAGALLWRTLTVYSAGLTASDEWKNAGAALLGGLWLLSLWAMRSKGATRLWVWVMALGQPVLLMVVSWWRPIYVEQYAIVSLPLALMVAGQSLDWFFTQGGRWSWVGGVGLAMLTLIALNSVQGAYFNPRYAKSPDWRAAAHYLETTARAEEVVILNLPDPAFFYYYHGAMPVEAAPPSAHALPAATEAQIQHLRATYQHFRFFYSPSPLYDAEGHVENLLSACCEKITDEFVAQFRVQTWDTERGSLAARVPYTATFETGLQLTGYRLVTDTLAPGERLQVTLFWTTLTPVTTSYTVFVHLLAADGFGVATADGLPREGQRPTDTWAVGETVIDPHPLTLDADMPPGQYQLEIGLYVLATGERLVAHLPTGATRDHLALPQWITVTQP